MNCGVMLTVVQSYMYQNLFKVYLPVSVFHFIASSVLSNETFSISIFSCLCVYSS